MLAFAISGTRLRVKLILSAALLCFPVVSPAQTPQRKPPRKRPVKQEQPAPAAQPAPAPPPPTLEQMPAAAPKVSFENGHLAVVAHNSTLGDILRAVRTQTGAVVDVPANATERVVGDFGPGPAREVLAALLNGTHFDYVMLGSATDATVLARVVLMPKSGSANDAVQSASSEPESHPPAANPSVEGADEETTNEDSAEGESEAQPETNEDQQQQQPAGSQPTIKTPEQLLQELQRQQRQQQATPQGFPTPPNQAPQPPQDQPPQ
jgi:hypothetical protein